MLSKREIRKEGFKSIIKQKQEHQSVYDRLKSNEKSENSTLAKELSKIPSLKIINSNKNLLYIFVGLMGIILLIRVAALIYLLGSRLDPSIVMLFVIGGIFAPVLGIYGALTYRLHLMQTVAFVFIIMIFRTIQDGLVTSDDFYVYIPFLVAIFLGIWIPFKMKTPFSLSTFSARQDDQEITYEDFKFEKGDSYNNDELLDDDL